MSIQGMEKMRAELFGQGEESSSLPSSRWQVDPNSLPVGEVSMPEQADQLSMFGKMGARTPFMFSGAAMAPEPMAPRRVGRFNVYRGGQ